MATSGSFNTSYVGNFYFTFSWNRTGYSSEANVHYIDYSLIAHNTAGSYRTVYLKNLYIAGQQVYYQEGIYSNGKQFYDGDVVTSGSVTVPSSNNEGDCTLTASFEAGVGVYSGSNCSGSGSWELDRIPRASVPTITGTFELGGKLTLKMNRASENFNHELYYYWNNDISHKYFNGPVGNECSFTIPKELADYVPSGVSGTLKIECTTYNGTWASGGAYIGSNVQTFTVKIPDTEEFKPKVSNIALSEAVSGLANQFGAYIQNQSKINGTVTATGAYSSTIKSYSVVINGATYNSSSFTTGTLNLSGTNTVSVTVTDTRNRSGTKTDTFTVLPYVGPTITKFITNRCNQDGVFNDEGAYVKAEVTAKIYSLNDKNTYSYSLQYKDTDDTNYENQPIELTATTSDGIIELTGSSIMEADEDNAFDYLFTVTDYFNSPSTMSREVGTVFQLINYNASGRGLAFGKVSEKNAFECNMDMYLYGKCHNWETAITKELTTGQEYATNEYIDGKRVYEKNFEEVTVINGGEVTSFKHNITDAERIWVDLSNSYMICPASNNRCLPVVQTFYNSYVDRSTREQVQIFIEDDCFFIITDGGWGTHWTLVVRLKYTKA